MKKLKSRGPTWVGLKPLVGPTKKTKITRAEKKYKGKTDND